MAKDIVFVLDPYHQDALKKLQEAPNVEYIYRDDPRSQNWREEATAIMIRSETRPQAADLAQAKKLKLIVKQGVGVDNIDLEAAKQHGIIVCNTPALNSESVAELTITLALCIARRVAELDRRVRGGEAIIRSTALGISLFKKTDWYNWDGQYWQNRRAKMDSCYGRQSHRLRSVCTRRRLV